MSKTTTRNQKPVPVSFRMDPGFAQTLDALAERKGVTRSDFIRGIVEKVLVPLHDEDAATAAAIEALPPDARKKALRAVVIQKRLRELRAERPKVHALSSLFQDGSGEAQDEETRGLERELVGLKKAFEAEVGPSPVLTKSKKKNSAFELIRVRSVDKEAEDGFEAECELCGKTTPAPKAEAGEVVDFNCAKCGGELKTNEDFVWPAADGDEPPADDEDEADDEADDEDEAESEKTDAEKEADRFLEITGLMNSLQAVRRRQTYWDYYIGDGPNAEALLIKKLEDVRGGAVLSEVLFEKLRARVDRAVEIRKKIRECETADQDAAGPTVKKLSEELAALKVELVDEAKKKKGSEKTSGLFGLF